MAGKFRRLRLAVRGNHLQVRDRRRGVAVQLHARQAGEMAQSAGDRGLVFGRLDHRGNRVIAIGGLAAAEVDDAVGHEDVAVLAVVAGIGGGRMADDQMIDRECAPPRIGVLQGVVFMLSVRAHGILWNLQ
jgi:hypothetical protein